MNNKRIDQIIREYAGELEEAELGYWKFSYDGQYLLIVTDENHNRMRVISPVVLIDEVSNELLFKCMEANFDRALDARYAISGEYLWSAFIHPLAELTDDQLIDALNQVVTLAKNFGMTFTSSELRFGAGE